VELQRATEKRLFAGFESPKTEKRQKSPQFWNLTREVIAENKIATAGVENAPIRGWFAAQFLEKIR
jgi:hypothetical protein